jgi:site-specific recombinase XerD
MNAELAVIQSGELTPTIDLEELLKAWGERLASDYATDTRKTYVNGFKTFKTYLEAEGLTLANVTPVTMRTWRDELKETYSTATVAMRITAVRRFYKWLIEEGAPIMNPAQEIEIRRRGGGKVHRREALSSAELGAVFDTCDTSPKGRRDRAIIALMAYCGLRGVEVKRANLADLRTMEGRKVLWVHGKGRAEADERAVLPVHAETILLRWLAERGDVPGPLFTGLGPRNRGGRLSSRQIQRVIMERYKLAGVTGGFKTMHSLRHTAITNAITHGRETLDVMAMARHKDMNTTLIYYHESDRLENPAEDSIDYGFDPTVELSHE